jgi:predicted MFS family arabinose efflux permease
MTGGVSRPGGLWRERDFALFWAGESTSEIGNAVSVIALPLVAVDSLHASTFAVTALTATLWLPWLVIGIPAGTWVDRLRPRRVMLACDVVSLLAFASVPAAAWAGTLSTAQLLVVALITGSSSVFFRTAYQVLLPGIVGEAGLAEGNSKLTGSRSAAQMVGPGIGGTIAQAAGPTTGLLADAFTFAVSLVCLLTIRDPVPRVPPGDRPRAHLAEETRQGLSLVLRDCYLRSQMIFAATANLALTGVDSLIVVFLVRTSGLPDVVVGIVTAAFGVGGVLGALAARPLGRHFGTSRAILLTTIGCLPFALLLPLARSGPGLAFAITANLLTSAGVVASTIIGNSFRQAYVPRDMLGRVSSAVMTASYATMPAGSLLAGLLASVLGTRATLWILAAIIGVSGLVFLRTPMRHLRDLPTRSSVRVH